MMGDNRDNSTDSRVSNAVGPVPLDNFVGRADRLFFSVDEDGSWLKFWRWPSRYSLVAHLFCCQLSKPAERTLVSRLSIQYYEWKNYHSQHFLEAALDAPMGLTQSAGQDWIHVQEILALLEKAVIHASARVTKNARQKIMNGWNFWVTGFWG